MTRYILSIYVTFIQYLLHLEYKEPTSRTKETTTNIPFTTKSFMEEYYEMVDVYNREEKYDGDVAQADGNRHTPENGYNNNNYFNRHDKSSK